MKLLTVAFAFALAILVVVACGGGEPTVSPGVTPSAAVEPSPTTASPTPTGTIVPTVTREPVAEATTPTPTATAASLQPPPVIRPTSAPTVVRRPNSDPMLAPVEDQAVAVGSTLSLTLSAIDPDGDVVSFGASPLPLFANASLDARTGSFVFSPDGTQVGSFQLTFEVTDGLGGTDNETLIITVEAPVAGGMTAASAASWTQTTS